VGRSLLSKDVRRQVARNHVLVLYGGPEAEGRYTGDYSSEAFMTHVSRDTTLAKGFALDFKLIRPAAGDAPLRRFRREAAALVKELWGPIRKVAVELLRKRTLDKFDVLKVVQREMDYPALMGVNLDEATASRQPRSMT
jgi:hypothetical protein